MMMLILIIIIVFSVEIVFFVKFFSFDVLGMFLNLDCEMWIGLCGYM